MERKTSNKDIEKIKKKNDKLIRKLRKNRWWLGFVIFIFIALMATALVTISTYVMVLYAVEDRIQDEVEYTGDLAERFDRMAETSREAAYDELSKAGRDFYITDESGKVLSVFGDNSSYNEARITYSIIEDINDKNGDKVSEYDVSTIYLDTNNEYIKKEEDGDFSIDVFKVLGISFSWKEGLELSTDINEVKRIPFWVENSIQDGNEKLVVKSDLEIKTKDTILALIMILIFIFVIFFALIICIVNFIKNLAHHRRINKLLFTDLKTYSHNWMWFVYKSEQTLNKWKNRKNNYAVMDFDFARYRNFCMAHSLEEGNKVLCDISNMISSMLDKTEICSHNESAHFAVLMKYEDENQLNRRIEDIITNLEGLDDNHIFAFHVGVDKLNAEHDINGNAIKMRNIDVEKAYNNACTAGASLSDKDDSGIAFFDEKFIEEQRWLDIVQENQQSALENEEFEVYYQPKYDPKTNELRGAEALIRWNSPKYGFVTPGRFIPIFEKNGTITEIDHYMITHVARDQKRWLDQGFHCVPVSVNVSRAHFIESDLAEQIRDMIDAEGTPHNLVEIELTESAFFDDKKAMITTIKRLKSYGFSVSMDDFGAGYSSLNSLKDMPLDVLKLDADFFRGESDDSDRGDIVVSEALRLARKLKMRTVAEGVEEKKQVQFLADHGCDMIQGYYFAKPMKKDEYEERMRQGVKNVEAAEEAETEALDAVKLSTDEAVEIEEPEIAETEAADAEEIASGASDEKADN